jgi:hypothetical protein
VIVALVWLGLAVGAGLVELAARRGAPQARLGQLLAPLSRTRAGRMALVLLWGYVGVHLFARYTVPAL